MGKKDKTPAPEPTKSKKDKGSKAEKPTKSKASSSDDEDDFRDPSSGDQFNNEENLGRLILVEPLEFEADFKTSAGNSDIVRANVYVLTTKKGKPVPIEDVETYENTILFGKVLVSSLKSAVGKGRVLGVLKQGVAKPGQSAPWIMGTADDDDKDLARKFIKKALSPFG